MQTMPSKEFAHFQGGLLIDHGSRVYCNILLLYSSRVVYFLLHFAFEQSYVYSGHVYTLFCACLCVWEFTTLYMLFRGINGHASLAY
jgi:hypothetical protein